MSKYIIIANRETISSHRTLKAAVKAHLKLPKRWLYMIRGVDKKTSEIRMTYTTEELVEMSELGMWTDCY